MTLSLRQPLQASIRSLRKSRFLRLLNPNWHRWAVGGKWDEIGELQFRFMLSRGLQPHHYLLDIGCGSLRGGVHFIRYLDPGHYYGVDRNKHLLKAGRRVELRRAGLEASKAVLVKMDNFDFLSLSRRFDYALAQSVFTHLPLNSIIRCIVNVQKVLVPGGQFYATFNENPYGKWHLDPIVQPQGAVTYCDRDPFHYDLATFQWACEGTGLTVEYIGDWKHPRHQKMLVFRNASGPR